MPWYGSGTLNVAANGTTASGTGTQFLGNVRVGDGIAIQGSATLHEVTGVTSNTQLTFAPAFAGTAGSGKAFRVVPVLGYDKDLSDAFNALRLEFGDQLSNLQPWATAPTLDAAQTAFGLSTSGKAVATGTPAQGRTALGLGTAATRDVTTASGVNESGRLLKVGDVIVAAKRITGKPHYSLTAIEGETENAWNNPTNCVFRTTNSNNSLVFNIGGTSNERIASIQVGHELFSYSNYTGSLHLNPFGGEVFANRNRVLDRGNTTVDSNGFIKNASPIIKLHSDRVESNSEGGPAFERINTGHYRITGCNGLRLTDGWYIETPHDKNGNKYFNVEWEQDHKPDADAGILEEPADVTLSIRCYERVWNPVTGQFDNGDPVDIPEGRWIDLRMNEVRQPEPEDTDGPTPEQPQQPVEPTEPVIPSVVTMAQAKLALLYAGMLDAVEQFINELTEPQKTAALIEWNHRQTLEREHPLVGQVADGLGLTEQQLDDLFVDASGR